MARRELTEKQKLVDLVCSSDEELLKSVEVCLPAKSFGQKDVLFRGTLARRRAMLGLLRLMSPAAVLDSGKLRAGVDPQNMIHRIGNMSRYMSASFDAAKRDLRGFKAKPKRVLVAGIGGSAIGPTMAVELLRNMGYSVPVEVVRHYPRPAADLGPDTLVVASSYSGNTEEMVAWYEFARARGCEALCVAKGGELAGRAAANDDAFVRIPVDAFEGDDVTQQPRESIGFSVATFLTIFDKLDVARKGAKAFKLAELNFAAVAQWLDRLDRQWGPGSAFHHNKAKQLAAHFLYGWSAPEKPLPDPMAEQTLPVVIVDEANAALGMRIENQFGECVTLPIKVLTFFEDAHNEIEQTVTCAVSAKAFGVRDRFSYTVLRSASELPRAKQRLTRTCREAFGKHGIPCLSVEAKGAAPFRQKLYLLKLLDYARAYASVLAGAEPLRVPFMDHLKNTMKRAKWPSGDA